MSALARLSSVFRSALSLASLSASIAQCKVFTEMHVHVCKRVCIHVDVVGGMYVCVCACGGGGWG